jgi:hypothetical protein
MAAKIGKKTAAMIVKALASGVVPSRGAEQIAVGRRDEVSAFESDFQGVSDGDGAFRFIIGEYGSGKTFMTRLVRARAADLGFVVMNADLTPSNRLRGSNGEGIRTYRQLIASTSFKGMMDGGAAEALVQSWLVKLKSDVAEELGCKPSDVTVREMETQIRDGTSAMSHLPFYSDFLKVVVKYYVRMNGGHDVSEAMRWLNGECNSITDSKETVGVASCVKDDNWYDFLKLWAQFAVSAGYQGLVVLIDQADVLLKTAPAARNSNYETLLAMYNDVVQSHGRPIAVYVCGTVEFLEDEAKGLYCYGALKTRIEDVRFEKSRDTYSGPVIRLKRLTAEEQEALLLKILEIHQIAEEYESPITQDMVEDYLRSVASGPRPVSPRMLSRDFIGLLDVLHAFPDTDFRSLIAERKLDDDVGQTFS